MKHSLKHGISFTTMMLVVVIMVLTLNGEVRGQALEVLPYSWSPEDYPNPQTNPSKCGLGKIPGYACDPNNLLTRHQLKVLNWFLEGIANTDNLEECPCSWHHCETHQGQRFYKVAVALVPRLKIPYNTNGRPVSVLDQANTFAYRLEHERWNMSSCEEDIVILYSQDDHALVTMTGRTAGRKLTPMARSIIHGMVGDSLAKGRINEGLERMVHEIKLVLNGERKYEGLLMAQQGGTGYRFLGSWLLVFLLSATSLAMV